MAASVGSLFVSLTADASQLHGGLAIAARDVSAFEARAAKSARGASSSFAKAFSEVQQAASIAVTALSGFGGGLLAGIASGATLAKMRQITNEVAEIGDAARRAGVSIGDFQRLRFVSSQNRVEVDALVDGIKELNLRADEFVTTGGGSAAEAFKRIGLNAGELKKRLQDPADLFVEVIDRLHRMNDTAAGIRIADEVFGGTGGEKFVQLIDQGADGIRRTMAEADRLGLVIEDRVVKQAAEVDRKFDAITQTISTGMKYEIVKSVEAMDELIDRFNAIGEQSSNNVLRSLQDVYSARLEVQDEIARMQEALAADPGNAILGADLSQQQRRLEALTARAVELRDILDRRQGYGKAYDDAGVAAAAATPRVAGLGDAVAGSNAKLREAADIAKDYAAALRALQAAGPAATSQAAEDAAARDRINGDYADALKNARSIGDQQRAEAARDAALAEQDRRERERRAAESFGGTVPVPTPSQSPEKTLDATPFQELADSARDDLAALEVERAAIGMTAREADVLRRSFELLNEARRAGIALSPEQEAELRGIADAQADIAEATRKATEAQAKQEAALADTRAVARDVFGSFVADLRQGKTAVEALAGALERLADRLLDRWLDSFFDNLFPTENAGAITAGNTAAASVSTAVSDALARAIGPADAAPAPPAVHAPVASPAPMPDDKPALGLLDSKFGKGRFSIQPGENANIDSRLLRSLRAAAESTGMNVQLVDGVAPRKSGTSRHPIGMAADVRIMGPDGKWLNNYQHQRGETFRAYERYAQAVRANQMATAPELNDDLRWGGYFGGPEGKYGALDLMHFDLKPGASMAGGSWEQGLNAQQRKYFPLAESVGMGSGSATKAAVALDRLSTSAGTANTALADMAQNVTGSLKDGLLPSGSPEAAGVPKVNIGPAGPAAGPGGAPIDLSSMLGGINWTEMFGNLLQSSVSGLGFGLGGLLAQWMFGGEHHEGGTAGTSTKRRAIPTSLLRGRGGQGALRSREIAAVLERGEKILTGRQWDNAVGIMSGVASQQGGMAMAPALASIRGGDLIVQGNVTEDVMPKVRQEILASERRMKQDVKRNLHVYNNENRDRN